MKSIISLMRPQQWAKNLFVFAPLFFHGSFLNFHLLADALIAMLSLCLAASAVYCFNDICDKRIDRLHPTKKYRPIASGKISVGLGYFISICLVVSSFLLLFYFSSEKQVELSLYVLLYLVMNVAYCLYLKHKTLIDVFIIASGFVIRILVGGVSVGIWVSHWLVLMTFLLSLFLALAKRRDDVVIYERTGMHMRRNTERYNLEFMNQAISIIATIIVICYILYTVSPEVTLRIGSDHLYITSVFVLLGVIRYLQLTIVDVRSGSPTHVLFHDRFTQACILGWIVLFVLFIYL